MMQIPASTHGCIPGSTAFRARSSASRTVGSSCRDHRVFPGEGQVSFQAVRLFPSDSYHVEYVSRQKTRRPSPIRPHNTDTMIFRSLTSSLLCLCLSVSFVTAESLTGSRLLVVLEDAELRPLYSKFFGDLEGSFPRWTR